MNKAEIFLQDLKCTLNAKIVVCKDVLQDSNNLHEKIIVYGKLEAYKSILKELEAYNG